MSWIKDKIKHYPSILLKKVSFFCLFVIITLQPQCGDDVSESRFQLSHLIQLLRFRFLDIGRHGFY